MYFKHLICNFFVHMICNRGYYSISASIGQLLMFQGISFNTLFCTWLLRLNLTEYIDNTSASPQVDKRISYSWWGLTINLFYMPSLSPNYQKQGLTQDIKLGGAKHTASKCRGKGVNHSTLEGVFWFQREDHYKYAPKGKCFLGGLGYAPLGCTVKYFSDSSCDWLNFSEILL